MVASESSPRDVSAMPAKKDFGCQFATTRHVQRAGPQQKEMKQSQCLKRLANMSGCHHFQHRSVDYWCMLQKNKKHNWSKIETYIRINKHKRRFWLKKGCGLKILPGVIITNNFWLTQIVSFWGDMFFSLGLDQPRAKMGDKNMEIAWWWSRFPHYRKRHRLNKHAGFFGRNKNQFMFAKMLNKCWKHANVVWIVLIHSSHQIIIPKIGLGKKNNQIYDLKWWL